MTAMNEAKEWIEAKEKGEKKTTSCCPAFKNYIEKHFPTLKDAISETVSPMCAASRYIKENFRVQLLYSLDRVSRRKRNPCQERRILQIMH